MDLFKPRGASTLHQPTATNQLNGRIYNQPRFAHLGGLSGVSKVGKTGLAVKKPGDGQKVI
jgi:hypothetical protein